ncbi:MAG: hypothetical protein Q8Q48_01805 [Candidatus Staskawiczbacteria bacterium]|nr:hypothetical protein [Candidatus Staskawiczbacteria bacterium]
MNTQKGFVLPIVIAIVVIAVLGTGGYYFVKNSNFKNPMSNVQSNLDSQNCGTTSFDVSSFYGNTDLLESNTVLNCLGQNLFSDCKKTGATLDTNTIGKVLYTAEKNKEGSCSVRIQYGNAGQIQNEEAKKLANKYIQCSTSMLEKFVYNDMTKVDKGKPSVYAFGLFMASQIAASSFSAMHSDPIIGEKFYEECISNLDK